MKSMIFSVFACATLLSVTAHADELQRYLKEPGTQLAECEDSHEHHRLRKEIEHVYRLQHEVRGEVSHVAAYPRERDHDDEEVRHEPAEIIRELEALEVKKIKVLKQLEQADSSDKRRVLKAIIRDIQMRQGVLKQQMEAFVVDVVDEGDEDGWVAEHRSAERERARREHEQRREIAHHERRMHALREAGERLQDGGVHEIAEGLFRQAEEIEQELRRHHNQNQRHENDELIHELMHNVHQLREEVEELHHKMDTVLEFIEEVREREFDEDAEAEESSDPFGFAD